MPDRRIVYTESVSDVSLLSVALVTWEVIPDGEVSRLIVTDQVASFVGPDMLEGPQSGTAAALDLLGAWLTDAQ